MYHGAEVAKGAVTAAAGGAGLAWLTYGNVWSSVSFAGSIAGAAWCWWLMHRAEQAKVDQEIAECKAESLRHQELLDAVQSFKISNIHVAAMLAEMTRPERKEEPKL